MGKLKHIAGDLYSWLASLTGRTDIERCCSNRLILLTFHRCLPQNFRERYPYPGLVITPEELSWLLHMVSSYFHIGTISDMVERFNSQKETAPLLGISFDDGQWDNYHYAQPVLEKCGCHATFYIPSELVNTKEVIWHDLVGFGCQFFSRASRQVQEQWVRQLPLDLQDYAYSPSQLIGVLKSWSACERSILIEWLRQNLPHQQLPEWARLMTWGEVRQLRALGHEIGSHSCSHAILPHLPQDQLRYEIEQSKKQIEAEVGVSARSLCYPNGDFDENCVRIAQQCGYTNGVTTSWGHNTVDVPPFALRRMDIDQRRHRSFLGNLSVARTKLRLANRHPGLRN